MNSRVRDRAVSLALTDLALYNSLAYWQTPIKICISLHNL